MAATLEKLNSFTEGEFIKTFGEIFEHSPWIAKKALTNRPFSSIEAAFSTMKQIVEQSGEDAQLALIKEHPELGKRIKMSESSVREQSGAGLDSLTLEEYDIFSELNNAYMEKFNFPFIIAVAGKDKNDILLAMKERLSSTFEQEFQTALQQIYKIAKIRYDSIIENLE
ncbi:2-oxo-4-hydroxy-4-carboxy-5-ureidoimidazoline decarboxylase [Lysinibacillus telephonicus]|uniref:2-oxo-4-hydroxy-4-carboxy-5-ureidoimidazoline decarboxylase n=1 Tax=Lysinibacillus telephonicus TaxID=1714840 RepID=UPI0031FE20B5